METAAKTAELTREPLWASHLPLPQLTLALLSPWQERQVVCNSPAASMEPVVPPPVLPPLEPPPARREGRVSPWGGTRQESPSLVWQTEQLPMADSLPWIKSGCWLSLARVEG